MATPRQWLDLIDASLYKNTALRKAGRGSGAPVLLDTAMGSENSGLQRWRVNSCCIFGSLFMWAEMRLYNILELIPDLWGLS